MKKRTRGRFVLSEIRQFMNIFGVSRLSRLQRRPRPFRPLSDPAPLPECKVAIALIIGGDAVAIRNDRNDFKETCLRGNPITN
jgi:hypothetical protein